MTRLKKFTSLNQEKIERIVSTLPTDLVFISKISCDLIERNENYQVLTKAFREAEDKKEFLDSNINAVAAFLNECRLIGYRGERGALNNSSFIIGAEGVAIISAYLSAKDRNAGSNPVEVVKNMNLTTGDGSRKHSNIFLEQQQVHEGFRRKLIADLTRVGEGEFNKTYLLETFGTTGGNHFVCVTIHKRVGEIDPVVYLFDPSPALVRNGIEGQQNSIANGWCSQLIVNATLKSSLEGCALIFSAEKYYTNSEPLQKAGLGLCAIFCCEAAHEISRMDPEEHRRMLEERFVYKGLFGGKTEMPISLEEVESAGYVMHPQLGLRAEDVVMSHFIDTAIRIRADELMSITHTKKNGSSESALARIARYSEEEDGSNQIVEQKSLRQKIGHIFEIVTNEAFLSRANEDVRMPSLPEIEGSVYFPKDLDLEQPGSEIADLVKSFNKLMPRTNLVNRVLFNEENQQYEIMVRVGDITGAKLMKFMRRNCVKVTSEPVGFAENLLDVNPVFSELQEITVIIPQTRFAELTEVMSEALALYKPIDHPFMPPVRTSPIRVEPLASRDANCERK